MQMEICKQKEISLLDVVGHGWFYHANAPDPSALHCVQGDGFTSNP